MAISELSPSARRIGTRQVLFALFAATAVLTGCQSSDPSVRPSDAEWRGILADAAITDGAKSLPPLTPLLQSRPRLVTWKKTAAANEIKSGGVSFPWVVWATVDGELQRFCRAYVREAKPDSTMLRRRIERLLGLRDGDGENRVIVTVEVGATDVYRPCLDPSITTTACIAPRDDAEMRRLIINNPEAVQLLLAQMVGSYVNHTGYPFTRRGYTYDWDSRARTDHFGLSEYEIRPDAQIEIVAPPKTLDEYCAPE